MSKVVFPSFTKTYHHKLYPAIDPTKSDLSAKGKVVFITGAGSGIGRATAIAFAQANAESIILTGRRTNLIEETKSLIESQNLKSKITCHALNVVDEESVQSVFQQVLSEYSHIDILIHGAGHFAQPGPLSSTPLSNFYPSFDVHVKGSFLLNQAFTTHKGTAKDQVLICMSSFICHLDATASKTSPASYAISKLAQAKLVEYIAAEHANAPEPKTSLRAYAVQPGIVVTEMSDRSVEMAPPGTRESMTWDDPALSGGFFVWLASGRGACVPSGRYLWVNWDVDELERRREDLEGDSSLLTQTLKGWPFRMPEEEV